MDVWLGSCWGVSDSLKFFFSLVSRDQINHQYQTMLFFLFFCILLSTKQRDLRSDEKINLNPSISQIFSFGFRTFSLLFLLLHYVSLVSA